MGRCWRSRDTWNVGGLDKTGQWTACCWIAAPQNYNNILKGYPLIARAESLPTSSPELISWKIGDVLRQLLLRSQCILLGIPTPLVPHGSPRDSGHFETWGSINLIMASPRLTFGVGFCSRYVSFHAQIWWHIRDKYGRRLSLPPVRSKKIDSRVFHRRLRDS